MRERERALIKYCFNRRSGHDPSRLFHRSVNKRYVPDYYEVIKEPMALSILKQKINKREYRRFSDFVRDCALVRMRHSPSFSLYTLRSICRKVLTVVASSAIRSRTMRKPTIAQCRKPTRMRLSSRYVRKQSRHRWGEHLLIPRYRMFSPKSSISWPSKE